ncbi:MAG: hypothetical protein AB1486_21115 [Planctomycetota bacterium]
MNDVVPAESWPFDIGDYDRDGIPDLMVKFDRKSVEQNLEPGPNVEIVVTGRTADGTSFRGVDYIRVF